jgi:tetratricopeptide (TPR) repeat protein
MAKKTKKIRHTHGQRRKTKQASAPSVTSALQGMLQHALALHQADHLPQAEALYKRILLAEPSHPEALNFLGLLTHQVGNHEIAIELINKAISLKPDYADAYNNLGLTLHDQGKLEEAAVNYQQALSLNSNFVEAHYNLGITLHEQGKQEDAAASYSQALSLKPDLADAHYNLGILQQEQGKLDDAIASYQQALIVEPHFVEAYHNLGSLFSKLGRMDDAIACYRKALSLKPGCARTYQNLSTIVKYTEVDEEIKAMEDLYNTKGKIADADRIALGFALGKAFEDLGDYDKSIEFILEANRLKRRSYEYSMQNEHDLFARTKQTFSPDFFAAHQGSGIEDRTPIFILGMPRSGTTLVEQILASHPLVFGAGELTILNSLVNGACRDVGTKRFPDCMLDLDMDAFARMGSEYIAKIREYSLYAEHITDKMPDNFLRVGIIKTILPAAKVIHCVRDPMDTCFSIFKNDFSGKGSNKYAYDMAELGRYYNLYRDLMAHWEKVLPGFMHSLRYEELISDQPNRTKSLLDFCGLPWNKACLDFHKTERRVGTASLAQVRQPIYKDSVSLWKRYEKQLEPLRKAIYG